MNWHALVERVLRFHLLLKNHIVALGRNRTKVELEDDDPTDRMLFNCWCRA